ncbi:hypothetical protein A2803_02520 [Candidatus Woesebacteria bacterium RIFCSPHIGHO2_01_FULL_44_21]|uniref:Peptidase S51 n=1 Tax=Candidatus Woesebacteria bacterium RIFCSPHIGHO2_01_FULL_44_21 TaxID=1802503 RepID=A0A1F7YXB2_9BACT|nr:MAG: hypothetical protein A2803_02520 [Candidatus Woesebacteria bacterium RIFCSPHIGHO2_01_FULL_44_21]OGM70457.1 MAG: hypothetical protein A2897_01705 [Candidatus Woesebacteria bacterium RIFCSPLOWO2_01_FULL_44_24b]
MKLALFSHNITKTHEKKLQKLFDKELAEVRFLYITTPTNYKPFKPDWCIESEERWRSIFPKLREFDLERAYRVDRKFNFKEYLSDFDFIFISGGNIFILTYWMRETGVDALLKKMILKDKVVYGGESAGAIYPYQDISEYAVLDDPDKAPSVVNGGLGVINFAPLPHWGVKDFQIGLEKVKVRFEKNNVKVITFADDEAIFVVDKEVEKCK